MVNPGKGTNNLKTNPLIPILPSISQNYLQQKTKNNNKNPIESAQP